MNDFEKTIEEQIGIVFANKDNLHQALIHRSYLNENKKEKFSNERLEFLGDAILEFIVTKHIFSEFPENDEGNLTALRAKLVNTVSLAGVARELSLGNALYLSRGEEQTGGRENQGLLANTIEALIGAIFIDQGLEKSQAFIQKFILSKVQKTIQGSLKDPKSILQEEVQKMGFPTPTYKVLSETGPDHAKKFGVEVLVSGKPKGRGFGSSKKIATQEAAREALKTFI